MHRRSFLRRVAVVAAGAVATVRGAEVFAKEPEAAPLTVPHGGTDWTTGTFTGNVTTGYVSVGGPFSGQDAVTLYNDSRLTAWCDGFVDETVQAMGAHTHSYTIPELPVRVPFDPSGFVTDIKLWIDDGAGSFVSPSPLTRHGAYLRGG